MNLGANAGHAMRQHGGILDVGLANVLIAPGVADRYLHISPGPYLELTVSDTGHGFSDRIKERIFNPHFSTKGKGEGTGLGLAVVHGIVKSHGGEITVNSERGKGTTFKIYLPVIQKAVEPKFENVVPAPGGSERILLIDDESVFEISS
jgi:signal transduction histidine kinase